MNTLDAVRAALPDGAKIQSRTGDNREHGQCVCCLAALVRPLMALYVVAPDGTKEMRGSLCRGCDRRYFDDNGEPLLSDNSS